MKKTQLTFLQNTAKSLLMAVAMVLISSVSSFSQSPCSLGCNSNVQVSLDNASCTAVITPQMMLGTVPPSSCPNGSFIVEVRHNGILVPNATVTSDHVGKVLEAKVIDLNSGNSCWGYLHIEDKLPPQIVCQDPDDIYCFELDNYEPNVIENCDHYTLFVTDSLVINNDCINTQLPDNVLKVITRTYIATDKSGNKSAPCTISFNVLAIDDMDDIDPPSNYLYPTNNLQCDGNWKKDANGNPHPDVTGTPKLDGIKLWPNPYVECNLLVDYRDQRLPAIGCVTKILRTWTIIEWSCSSPQRDRTITQMIEIADTKAPVITGAKDLTVSTSPHKCEAIVQVPAIKAVDNCTPENKVTVTVSGGIPIIYGNGGTTTLEIGYHQLTYRATDACGNYSEETIYVWVEDRTPPVAVCDQNTVVGLTSDGKAYVHASSFDDGSYDECQLAKMLVRRMDTPCGPCDAPEFPGFHYLGTRDGHYYYASSHPLVGRHAFKTAKAMGGYAVSLETQAEAQWLAGQLGEHHKDECYTIGLNIDLNHNETSWESGAPFIPYALKSNQMLQASIDPNDIYLCLTADTLVYGLTNYYPNKYIVEITDPCGFSSYARFCCEDIGTAQNPNPVMVQFRVIDAASNWNDCMVNAIVQDKLPPVITCPYPVTVNCDTPFDFNNLGATFGTATVSDNCGFTMNETYKDTINQCNIGHIVRTITATDNGQRTASCTQRITFKQTDPFWVNIYNPNDPNDDIIWPADVAMEGCDDPTSDDYLPSETGRPVILDGVCQLVGADYDDQIFTFNNTNGIACFKILRTWTIIDWCQFINGKYETWSYTQVIKVNNTVKPVIISSCAAKEVCTYDAECLDGFIELTASATDDCTRGLKWYAKIDLYNNGSFESGLSKSGTGTSATQANPTIANASGTYPVGSHRVHWIFEDKCGNITACDQYFTIVNCKAATPYLLNGLAVDLMPQDLNNDGTIDWGMVEIWASDFDNGSFHPCHDLVYLSFTPNINDRSMIFECPKGRREVTIYASVITPLGDTIRSWAKTFIDIQDNMNACPSTTTGNRVAINGNVMTETAQGVENATIVLQSTEQMLQTSNNEGQYNFVDMPVGGSYVLSGLKDDDYMNGVSTLDLVLIQRHILGIDKLTSPYLLIAADVNKDKKITASDLVDLRKLILGINDKLQDNNSWRFIDKSFTFADPYNAHSGEIKESYEINELHTDVKVDFTAVKVGDVNASAVANAVNEVAEPRSNTQLNLIADAQTFIKGQMVTMNLRAETAAMLTGMQFTLKYNAAAVEIKSIDGLDADVTEGNIGWNRINEGLVTLSWNKDNAQEVSDVVSITFYANVDGNTSNLFEITSDVTRAEAYSDEFEVMNVTMRSAEDLAGFELYQNTPNPFSANTNIQFRLPAASDVSLKIFDITGKVVKQINRHYAAGTHTINIEKSQLSQSGVLYYQVEAGEYTATRKMVVIE
ncbi:MAG: T9SS type A sorting domain-containing protein [Saprospiraceae bacterium]|nr:T9SS type A sorting domain-containing protein [Saprospiraceae bacterium]